MTPAAIPNPSAVVSTPKPASPAWSTSPEKSGPSGTSIPPPMRPVARPTLTARTTGFTAKKRQPSFSSPKVWLTPTPPRAPPPALERAAVGRVRVEMMSAESTNVAAPT